MKMKMKMKRAIALVLSIALVLGLAPSLPGIGETWAGTEGEGGAEAEENTPTAGSNVTSPSVTAYATKEELKTEFTPNDAGTQAIGKLAFGKDGLEWYILGQDSGEGVKDADKNTEGNNTVIFATEVIGDRVYHGEPLHSTLDGMASNTYFTNSELGLMLTTTAKYSASSGDSPHTAKSSSYSGKLYALDSTDEGDAGKTGAVGDTYITAGSDDSIKVPADPYWVGCNAVFWLRSGDYGYVDYAFVARRDGAVFSLGSSDECAVRPASAINLSDVSFASAATAASSDTAVGGSIAAGTAMKLRLNSKDYAIGEVYLKEDDGVNKIEVVRGTTLSQVSLIVQGKDSTEGGKGDWYYSKVINNNTTVSAEDIAGTVGITLENTDLADCKIWLEIPGEEGSTLSYVASGHVHVYPTSKATPTELMKSDGISHWWVCTDENCPDTDKGKMNMAGELGKTDPHHFVKTKDEVTDSFKDNQGFLKDGTGDVTYRENATTGELEKVTTYYVYCWDCEYKTSETFEYVEPHTHTHTDTGSEDD